MSHVLVVDDDRDVRAALIAAVRSVGYRTTAAGDGLEALNLFKENSYDMGIFDIDMPSLNGLELTRQIRAIDPEFPVILITGYAQLYTASEVLALDVEAFLRKPIQLNELLNIVAGVIGDA